jgi:hypothetical protein
VVPQQYLRNHLASAAYLRGFTDDSGQLTVVNLRSRRVETRAPERVAFRNRFWGRDETLRADIEQRLSRVEGQVPRILEAFVKDGPPEHGSVDRGLLLEFLAMHFVRNPMWQTSIREWLEQETVARGHDGPEWQAFRDQLHSDWNRADTAIRQIPLVAALLGSTHWTHLRLPEPWFLTCDQPLVAVPILEPGERVPTNQTPGLMETVEFRFVLDPKHALIMSWLDDYDPEDWANGNMRIAADINRSVAGHCDVEYFHKPGVEPPFVVPPFMATGECNPISGWLHPGYSSPKARSSVRRARAGEVLHRMIEDEVTHEIRVVRPEPRASVDPDAPVATSGP